MAGPEKVLVGEISVPVGGGMESCGDLAQWLKNLSREFEVGSEERERLWEAAEKIGRARLLGRDLGDF